MPLFITEKSILPRNWTFSQVLSQISNDVTNNKSDHVLLLVHIVTVEFCQIPSDPMNGKVIEEPLNNSSTALRKARYTCDEGYNLSTGVNAAINCDSNGMFNFSKNSTCVCK